MPPASSAPPGPDANTASPVAPPDATQPGSPVLSPGAAGTGTSKDEDIEDIRPPLFFLISWWPWILGVLGALLLTALIVLLVRLLRRPMSPKTAYELALDRLEKARTLMREDDPAPYAVEVSETIRTYLGQRFQLPSSRRTTEEFLRQMQADASTPLAAHREQLGAFLQSCDLVKFARYQPRLAELEEVQTRALDFVQATKPAVSPEKTSPVAMKPVPAAP